MWEQAWVVLLEQKQIVINVILISVTQITLVLLIQNEILQRNHSLKYMIAYFTAKILILDIFFYILLNEYMQQHFEIYALYIILKLFSTICSLLVQWYTYDADFIKCVVYSMTAELLTLMIASVSMFLAGNMDRRMETLLISSIGWKMVRFIIFCFFIFYIVRFLTHHILGNQLQLLKRREIKYKKFWAVIIMFYIGATLYQNRLGSNLRLASTYKLSILVILIIVIGASALAVWIYRKYQQQTRQEHELLDIKQNLMVLHMKAVRQQILDMENEQKIIDHQMKNIKYIGSFEEMTQIEKYLKTLKKQYQKIQAGVYTDDVFVDSVLYYYADMLRRKNLTLEIFFAKYQRNSLDEMCAGKILMCLMEAVLTKNREDGQKKSIIKLYGGTVKNQVIVRLKYKVAGNRRTKERTSLQRLRRYSQSRKLCKMLRRYVKQFGGNMQTVEEENQLKIETILAGRDNNAETNVSHLEIQS